MEENCLVNGCIGPEPVRAAEEEEGMLGQNPLQVSYITDTFLLPSYLSLHLN